MLICVGEDFAHLNNFVRVRAVRLFIDLKKTQITTLLDTIQAAHDHPHVVTALRKTIKYLPWQVTL